MSKFLVYAYMVIFHLGLLILFLALQAIWSFLVPEERKS